MTNMADDSASTLIEGENLSVDFSLRHNGRTRALRALDHLDVRIRRGEILALVGESGCGKSTLGRTLLRLYRPASGKIVFDGVDITNLSGGAMRPIRRRMQMIFQNAAPALNPRLTLGRSIGEPLESIGIRRDARRELIDSMLLKVGLSSETANRFPHELSGGQQQRVAIARALVGKPDFVVADEPLASLDLSVQAQVMVLLKGLQSEFGITLLFITHDLAAAEYLSDRITVMYLCKMVEIASARRFSQNAQHPYSRGLLSSIPVMDPVAERNKNVGSLRGEIPSPLDPPTGCRFHTRCPLAESRCRQEEPPLRKIADEHHVACWVI